MRDAGPALENLVDLAGGVLADEIVVIFFQYLGLLVVDHLHKDQMLYAPQVAFPVRVHARQLRKGLVRGRKGAGVSFVDPALLGFAPCAEVIERDPVHGLKIEYAMESLPVRQHAMVLP